MKKRNSLKNQLCKFGLAATTLMTGLTYSLNVFAADSTFQEITVNPNMDPIQSAGMIIGVAVWAVRLFGAGLAIWGFYQLGSSFQEQRPEERGKALLFIGGGILAAGGPNILQAIGIIQGI